MSADAKQVRIIESSKGYLVVDAETGEAAEGFDAIDGFYYKSDATSAAEEAGLEVIS